MRPFPNRRRLLAALPLFAAPSLARAACRPPVVLFVCPAGTVKSPIAREALRRRAQAAGLAVDARSRAVSPADHVSPELAARLVADRFELGRDPPQAVTAADVAAADLVIAFDAAAEEPLLKAARAWRTPSWNTDYDAAKVDLDGRIAALVAELAGACR